ncbi:energy transducer TonB [Candidatus Omnitrophota bacterium]
MVSDKTLRAFLLISLLIHCVIFITLPKFSEDLLKKSLHQLEITYHQFQVNPKLLEERVIKKDEAVFKRQELAIVKQDTFLTKLMQKKDFLKNAFKVRQKPLVVNPSMKDKKIVIPELKSKIKSPAYRSYYQTIREKIRDLAYLHYVRYGEGEVYLSFILVENGDVKQIKIFEDKSIDDFYLKDVAVKSIKEAAPFPPFPDQLEYPELSFNVIISFEVDN